METEPLTIAFLVTLIGAVGGLLGIWFRVEKRINDAAAAASLRAEAANAQAMMVKDDLAEHKLHVAETYVSKAGLREVRDEIMTAMRDLKGSVTNIHARIDQVMLDSPDRRRSPGE